MTGLLQNVGLRLRSLRRTPGFSATVVLTLALGIGLSTAVFTVANAFLLRPLAVRDQNRVVVLWGITRDGRFDHFPLFFTNAREFASRTRSLERVEFFGRGGAAPVPIRDGSGVIHLRRSLVSGGYFELLGTRPVLGRTLRPEDNVVGAAPVVVLSYGAWQRYFGGDPNVVGRRIVLQWTGEEQSIVGVMPVGLDYPQGTDFWVPVLPNATAPGKEPYAELHVLGRLRPGASAADARAELTNYFTRPGAEQWERDVRGVVHPLPNAILGDVKPAVLVFAAAATLLLLITCINVANLLLVHGLGRVREIAVRSALGAGRGRIIAQLITESALLAVAGGMLGAVLGAVAVKGFLVFAPAGTPRLDEIHLDATAIAAAVAITAIVTLLFALAPALVTSRVELQDVLRAGSRQSGASRRFRVGTEALVVGQVALAVLVLSAAGIIARSFMKLERVDLAMEPAQLFIAELAGPYAEFEDTRKLLALLDRLQPRVEAIPGVRAASLVLKPPFSGSGIDGKVEAEGQTADDAAGNPVVTMDAVTPSYFVTFGIRILRGRAFSEQDREGSARVAIISESAARHYWPARDPVGRRLTWDAGKEAVTVVGIVPDTRYRDLRTTRPSIYFPLRQTAYPVAPMTLGIRFDGRLANLLPAVRRAVAEADPRVAVASASAFETLLQAPRAQPRLNALLLAVFAGAAVALAGVGLFGVMATTVRQRTKELGVRMALGATSNSLQGLVMRRGLTIAAMGSAMGLLGAVLGNRLLVAMLYDVSPTDSLTLGAVAVVLLCVAAVATFIPARATTRIDPVIALRAEG